MHSISLLQTLVYLDTNYISDLYEVVSGRSPRTLITKNQGKKASATAYLFSAEVNAQETRSFPVSTLEMLSTTLPTFIDDQELKQSDFASGMQSKYGWIKGELTVFRASSKIRDSKSGENKITASDAFYQIRPAPGINYALITTPEYFASGISAFVKLQETLLKEMSIPVRAYVRIFAAKSHIGQPIAVPFVILEQTSDA